MKLVHSAGAHLVTVRHCDLTYNLFGIWIAFSAVWSSTTTSLPASATIALPSAATASSCITRSGHASPTTISASCAKRHLCRRVAPRRLQRQSPTSQPLRFPLHEFLLPQPVGKQRRLDESRRPRLMGVRDQVVRNNRTGAQLDHGIMLRTIQNARVENNIVAGNARGFSFMMPDTTRCRTTWWWTMWSAYTCGPAQEQQIEEGNDFISNREPVRYVDAKMMTMRPGTQQSLEQLPGLGPQRRQSRRHSIRSERHRRPPDLETSHDETAAGEPCGTIVAAGGPAVRCCAPSVIDPNPHMRPSHPDWRDCYGKHYPGSR